MKAISSIKTLAIGGVICSGGLLGWYFFQPSNDGVFSSDGDTVTQKKTTNYPIYTGDGKALNSEKKDIPIQKEKVEVETLVNKQHEAGENKEAWKGTYDAALFMPSQLIPDVKIPPVVAALIARLTGKKKIPQVDRALLRNEFRKWAKADGEGALISALREFPRGDIRLDAAMASIRGWLEVDVKAAADYVASLHTPQQDYLVYNTAADYGGIDGQNAVRWALTNVPIEYRNGAAQHAMLSWVGGDTEGAINWLGNYVANEMRGGRAEKTMVWEAVFSYTADSLEGAKSFVESLPQVDAMEAGVNAVVDRWMDQDRIAAGKWIQKMAGKHPGLPLDDVYQIYAMQEAEVDPQNALEWAQSIIDERKREQTIEIVNYKIEQSQ